MGLGPTRLFSETANGADLPVSFLGIGSETLWAHVPLKQQIELDLLARV
jgi:hypothetical protein